MEFKCEKCGHTQYEYISDIYDNIDDDDIKRLEKLYDYVYRSQADEQYWYDESAKREFVTDCWIEEQNTKVKRSIETEMKREAEWREYERRKWKEQQRQEELGKRFWKEFKVADEKIEGYLRMVGLPCDKESVEKFRQEQLIKK